MAGFCDNEYGCWGSMEIAAAAEEDPAFPLNCPAWDLYGYQQLWAEFAIRTDEIVLPTAPGRRSYPGRLDQSEYEMTLYVTGEADSTGVAYADPWEGLYLNLQALMNNVFLPVGTGRGTRAATMTFPLLWATVPDPTVTADVKFEPLRQVEDIEDPRFAVYRTTMIVPAGRFVAPVGS